MSVNNPLEAFSIAAGVTAHDFSLLIRIAILAGFLLWSTWCVLDVLKYYKSHPHESIASLFGSYIRIFFLVSVVIALVFIP